VVEVEPDSAGWVVEAPVEVESRIVLVVYPDQRARSDRTAVKRYVRHLASLAYPAPRRVMGITVARGVRDVDPTMANGGHRERRSTRVSATDQGGSPCGHR